LFDHVLTICAVCLGFALVRTLRQGEGRGRSYAAVVAGLLALCVAAILQGSRFLGVVALGLSLLAVAVPAGLEAAARTAFAAGRLRLAVWMCGVRALLMPGAGLARQQEILRGLALLERHGVDRALSHFRGLAGDAEGGESMLIHEQIVSMLFYGQRWDEGIAHYESRFHPRYAALRPALALGLLRAYGESGRIDTAAGLLRALEEGPVGTDPGALGFVSQARLTFLAYAGASPAVHAALTESRRRALGLSPASSALLRGIALARAGEVDAAQRELSRVPDLAGASDDRIVAASRSTIDKVGDVAVRLPPELSHYADAVAVRLESFLQAAPQLRRVGHARLAPLLALVIVLVELLRLAADRGGLGLLDLGVLTAELWQQGSWGRAFVGPFVAGQPLSAVVDAYAVWVGGRLIERVLGRGRLALVALGGAAVASVVSATLPGPNLPLGGASLLAIAVATGALLLLPASRTPGLGSAARRALLVPLLIVLAAQLGGATLGAFALDVPLAGVWVAALWGVLSVGLVPTHGPVARFAGWLGVALALPLALGIAQVAREDIEVFMYSRRVEVRSPIARVRLPPSFVGSEGRSDPALRIPLVHGWVDALAMRTGDIVQLLEGDVQGDVPLPLQLAPALRRELDAVPAEVPPVLLRRMIAAGAPTGSLRAHHLRRNGEDVALVIERVFDEHHRIALVGAPPQALSRAPLLYGATIGDAVVGSAL
jgi:membrane associated rhomboid family serine protease